MKAAVCFVLLAVAFAAGAEEKKNEKRGIGLGLGYGLSHGYGLGNSYGLGHGYGLGHSYYGHGLGLYSGDIGLGHGYYGGHGLYDHGVVASAPIISHSYSAPLHYSAPVIGHGIGLGLGHGIGFGHGHGWK